MSSFDPYHHWLGIPPEDQPPDHYRLLGVARFESDGAVIESAAERRMAHVRTFQTGPRAAYTQRLLNELAAAKICLLNPIARSEYDASLLNTTAPDPNELLPTPIPPDLVKTTSKSASEFAPLEPAIQIETATSGEPEHVGESHRSWLFPVLLLLAVVVAFFFLVTGRSWKTWLGPDARQVTQRAGHQQTAKKEAAETGPAPVTVMQEGSGDINFPKSVGTLSGNVRLETSGDQEMLSGWSTEADQATWSFRIVKLPSQGVFQVRIKYFAQPAAQGSQYVLDLGESKRAVEIRATGEVVEDEFYFAVPRSGQHRLTFRLSGNISAAGFQLHSLQFTYPGRAEPKPIETES